MEQNSEQKLKELLTNITDSYEDFVHCELAFAKKRNYVDKMIAFIENSSPELTTSDVIKKGSEFSGL